MKTIVLVAVSVSTAVFGADWEMRVTDNAAVEISHSQVPIVKADYCFWGTKWSYAGAKVQMGQSRGSDKTFTGNVSALGLKFNGTVRSLPPNKVRYTWIIDTDRTQAVHGWVGGESLRLKQTSFDITTPKAAVAVSSLDGEAIGKSRKILISAVARAVPSSGGRMPMLSEPVKGRIQIAGPRGLKLIPLAGDASRLRALKAEYADGKYFVELPAQSGTHWFMLAAEE